jgi:hypothetical protein
MKATMLLWLDTNSMIVNGKEMMLRSNPRDRRPIQNIASEVSFMMHEFQRGLYMKFKCR